MTPAIRNLISAAGLHVCPDCQGTGETSQFCGHYVEVACRMCAGHGVITSLARQTQTKTCSICKGVGGAGCCRGRGYHEWESYSLI